MYLGGQMNKLRDEMARQAQMIAHQAHEKYEKHQRSSLRWGKWNFWLGTITLILSVITTSSTIRLYFGHDLVSVAIVSILSLVVTVLTAILKFHNPDEKGKLHVKASNGYMYLQHQANLFYSLDVLSEAVTEVELRKKLDHLLEQEHKLNDTSIPLPSWVEAQNVKKEA
jgi:hypothetical protein